METKTFNNLKEKAVCDTGNDLETIGFRAKYSNYHMSFYACADEDYKVVVEDFGCVMGGDWKQQDITASQLEELQVIVTAKADELYKRQEQENVVCDWDVRAEQGIFGYGY